MVSISVVFENSNKFYFEGEKIRGSVEVTVDELTEITNILANFVGLSNCLTDGTNVSKFTKMYDTTLHEVYFDEIIALYLPADKEDSLFDAGTRKFQFEFMLPYGLPTSLESAEGYVRYSMQVNVEAGGQNHKKIEYITVLAKVDLNIDASAKERAVVWQQSNQCIASQLCFPSKLVNIFLHIPKKGYVPGEDIKINAEIHNNHIRSAITYVKACLVQVLKYHCPKVMKKKHVISEVLRGSINSGDNQNWNETCLPIPAIPPTTYPPKKLIHVRYKLHFIVKPSWREKCYVLKQRLIIGAVPLMEYDSLEKKQQGEGDVVSAENFYTSNLEPCHRGPHLIEEDGRTVSFSPLYPVYTGMCQAVSQQ